MRSLKSFVLLRRRLRKRAASTSLPSLPNELKSGGAADRVREFFRAQDREREAAQRAIERQLPDDLSPAEVEEVKRILDESLNEIQAQLDRVTAALDAYGDLRAVLLKRIGEAPVFYAADGEPVYGALGSIPLGMATLPHERSHAPSP